MPAITIAFINFKGGCCKTSSTVNLGAALARQDKQVLLVDLDPQGHVSLHLGIDEEDIKLSVEDVLGHRTLDMSDIIIDTDETNLFVAPSRKGLLHARHVLMTKNRREALLWKSLRPVVSDFDYILTDTPPDEGVLTANAMYASDYLIIPTPPNIFSLNGIASLLESIENMEEAYESKKVDILGVLVNRYDARLKRRNRDNLNELHGEFKEKVFDTFIRSDEEIEQAQKRGQTIFQRPGKVKGAEDFTALACEVACRLSE